MNSNSFLFDDQGHIVRSKIYDRTGFRGQNNNHLLPHYDLMKSFAEETNFLRFYEENNSLYRQQITFMEDSLGLNEMQNWLQSNFPDIHPWQLEHRPDDHGHGRGRCGG